MKNIQTFLNDSRDIIKTFNNFILDNGLQNIVVADHICFKCESSESYEELRKLFEGDSFFIYQSIISRRRIAFIKFKNSIETLAGPINYLELSDQKPNNSQVEGFDHIEIVYDMGNFDSMKEEIENKGIILEINAKPHHTTFDLMIGKFNLKLSEKRLVDKIKTEEFK